MSLSAHKVKVQIMYKIDKRICFIRKVKSPKSLLQGPQESSLTVEWSIWRKPCLFIIRFLNGPRTLQQCHRELKGPIMTSMNALHWGMPFKTSLTKRSLIHLHQVANLTFLEPSDHSTSSQAKISSMEFFFLLFKFIMFAHLNSLEHVA